MCLNKLLRLFQYIFKNDDSEIIEIMNISLWGYFNIYFKNDELYLGDPGHTNTNNTKCPKCTNIHNKHNYRVKINISTAECLAYRMEINISDHWMSCLWNENRYKRHCITTWMSRLVVTESLHSASWQVRGYRGWWSKCFVGIPTGIISPSPKNAQESPRMTTLK